MCSKACARVARHVVSIGAALKVDATYVPLEADATYVQLPNYHKKKIQEKLQRMCHWRRMQLSATYVQLPNCVPTRGGCAFVQYHYNISAPPKFFWNCVQHRGG